MNIDELLLNLHTVSFDSLICQTSIQSDEDMAHYNSLGYHIDLTEEAFRKTFSIDPSCIWYTQAISPTCLYFNEKTLAASILPLDFVLNEMGPSSSLISKGIQEKEGDVANNRFGSSLISLPDSMRMEYFNRLIALKGTSVPDLYQLFFSFYKTSDYGFGKLSPETLNTIISTKTQADKEQTAAAIKDLSDIVRIYRGGNSASVHFSKAHSWTLDINTANFFASRRGTDTGYIAEANVRKQDIIDAFLDSGEQEIFVHPKDIQVLNTIPVRGYDYLKSLLPQITPIYHYHKNAMLDLEFAQDSEVHGLEHQARVLLLCLMLAQELNLPARDVRVLATAAIFHDTQRTNDDTDPPHGKASREYYHANVKNPDPLVEFLCEYHSLPDEEGYSEIKNNRQLSKNRSRAKLLLGIFKDADALDRVRFGIQSLDLNQLRIPVSKELSLIARLCFQNIKITERPKIKPRALSDLINSAAAAKSEKQEPAISRECTLE